MAISYISTASAAANTVAMPSHVAGDMIVAFTFRDGNATAPTIPAGWQGLGQPTITGANTCSISIAYKIAASGSETTGTWTNATGISVGVYRNAAAETWTTPTAMTTSGTGGTLNYVPANFYGAYHTIAQDNTEVWCVRFAGQRDATNLTTNTPTGWTARGGTTTETRIMDTNGRIAGFDTDVGVNTQSTNGTTGYFIASVRIEAWNGTGMVCMGSDAGPSGSQLIMPRHQTGDLILAYSNRANNTAPTTPSGYTSLSSGGADTFSTNVAYKIAASAAEASPVFTNATYQTVSIYRSSNNTWYTPELAVSTNGNTTPLTLTGNNVGQVADAVTGYVRFAAINSAEVGFITGWVLRGLWNVSPAAKTIDHLNAREEADTVGQNAWTVSSVAWRTNTIRIAFNPNKYENINYASATVPANVAGCYLTMIGGGGGGGGGATRGGTGQGNGGGGGGGGAAVERVFVPASSLGSTYSLTRGTGGASVSQGTHGNAGSSSTFTSGSTTITAGGGGGGQSISTPTAGAGGTPTIPASLSYVGSYSGMSGGAGSTTGGVVGTVGQNSTTLAGAGGGGGGSNKSSSSNGGKGGDSTTVTGGNGGAASGGHAAEPADSATGLGGAGGGGGAGGSGATNGGNGGQGAVAGAGGGGGGGKEGLFASGGGGAPGGDGYTMIEWVPATGSFFAAWEGF